MYRLNKILKRNEAENPSKFKTVSTQNLLFFYKKSLTPGTRNWGFKTWSDFFKFSKCTVKRFLWSHNTPYRLRTAKQKANGFTKAGFSAFHIQFQPELHFTFKI